MTQVDCMAVQAETHVWAWVNYPRCRLLAFHLDSFEMSLHQYSSADKTGSTHTEETKELTKTY